ncbi:MAG: hypothetical protein HOE90_14290 [Bacteriovoracaceae bacterium]|jgi:hypothetical protein|nr:hypothetical protein [Bacteriovoracaceae bacterium]
MTTNSSAGSGNSSGRGNRKPNNRNRKGPSANRGKNQGNRSKNPNSKSAQASGKKAHAKGRGPAKKGRPYNKRRRRPETPQDAVYRKYINLLMAHLEARQKYYSFFDRADKQKRIKLEKNFYSTLRLMREFESSLSEQETQWLTGRTDQLKKDFTYSSNHELKPEVGEEPPAKIVEPHYLTTQIEAVSQYKEDTEESVGTIDDYKKYKEKY